jgi:hypothetical protein
VTLIERTYEDINDIAQFHSMIASHQGLKIGAASQVVSKGLVESNSESLAVVKQLRADVETVAIIFSKLSSV